MHAIRTIMLCIVAPGLSARSAPRYPTRAMTLVTCSEVESRVSPDGKSVGSGEWA